jgi:hypothetical protein
MTGIHVRWDFIPGGWKKEREPMKSAIGVLEKSADWNRAISDPDDTFLHYRLRFLKLVTFQAGLAMVGKFLKYPNLYHLVVSFVPARRTPVNNFLWSIQEGAQYIV